MSNILETVDPNQQMLTLLSEYRRYFTSSFPTEEEAANNTVLQVLICFEKTLQRRIDKTLPNAEWINCMKWAVSEANQIMGRIYDVYFHAVDGWNPLIELPANPEQNLAAVLMTLTHELLGDIGESEAYLKLSPQQYAEQIISAYEALGAEHEQIA